MADLITEAEIMAIKESFALFDLNLMGYLDFDTVSTLLTRLNYDNSNLESFLHPDQTISFNQFANLIARHLRSGFDSTETSNIFHEMDSDNTNSISAENFSEILSKFNVDISLEEAQTMIDSMSSSGEVDFDLFNELVKTIGQTEEKNRPKPKPKGKKPPESDEDKRKRKVSKNIGMLLNSLS